MSTVDSNRVYATAHAGPDVPILSILGPSRQVIDSGATAPIAVRTAPGALVSFATRNGGLFPNQREAITVRAGDDGVATTSLFANPGTLDDTSVQAGSPAASGTVSVIVNVRYPATSPDPRSP